MTRGGLVSMAALDAASPDAAALKTLVAVCAANAGPDVIGAATAEIELGRRLSAAAAGVVFVRTEGLCADPDAVRAHISSSGAKRLALGVCPGEFSQTAVQQAGQNQHAQHRHDHHKSRVDQLLPQLVLQPTT